MSGLNPEQQAIVDHATGPLYVGAVAGCGKTASVVARIAKLIQTGTPEARILAVTFSTKAAGEMNARLAKLLGPTDARIGTWHSLALQVIRQDRLPESDFRVDEKGRHKTLVKEACGFRYLDWKTADASKLMSFIGYCKANMWEADSDDALDEASGRFLDHEAHKAVKAYAISDDLLRNEGTLTFDDMLVAAARHLLNPDNAARWGAKWDHVIVDEAQDNSVVQEVMANALSAGHRNIMQVGDLAQAIYSFRGSTPAHLAGFAQRWEGCTTVMMNRNYRSGRAIIAAANRAIAPAAIRLPVEMVAERDAEGSTRATRAAQLDDEAREFADWVAAGVADGMRYSDHTCLFRVNAQSRALEDELLKRRVPYVVVGGTSFYERKEVKDLLGYLRVATGRDQDGDAVRRCVNAPFRFLGKAFVEQLMALAAQHDAPAWPALVEEAAQQARIQRRQVQSAAEWCDLIESVEHQAAALRQEGSDGTAGSVLFNLVQRTGYVDWIAKEQGEESIENSAASNVRELIRVAQAFKTVDELLDYVDENIRASAKQRRKKGGDCVLLMSIHRSKGLEWPRVWVVGCNDGVLPHGKGDPEEERRLFYVAVTRARDELVCSYVEKMVGPRGPRDMAPSGFLKDAGLIG